MKWIIAGGTGFIGMELAHHIANLGYEVVILSRKHQVDLPKIRFMKWNPSNPNSTARLIDNADVLVNLCGLSVDTRYTEANKQALYESRLTPTRTLAEACHLCERPPKQILQMSTATIYRDSINQIWKEDGELGEGFSVDLASKWEAAARDGFPSDASVKLLRTSIVLGTNGGAFPHFKWIARAGFRGFGGRNLKFSWIHIQDFCRACVFLAHHSKGGIYNLAARPTTVSHFLEYTSRKVGSMPLLKMPEWMINLGAHIMKTEPELLLKSRYVYGQALIDAGFEFRQLEIEEAIQSLTKPSGSKYSPVEEVEWG